jgi:ferric-dicitrate binding protein FerR (iron transport regulator)
MSEQSSDTREPGAAQTLARNANSGPTPQNPPGAQTEKPGPAERRRMLLGAAALAILAAALWFGIPWARRRSTPSRPMMPTSMVT